MRAVVTGGAGFIGSHLADALVARGDDVAVVDNLARGTREHIPREAQFYELDIQDDVAAAFADIRPDVCFHLAAQADVRVSVSQPANDASVNVIGSINVLEAAGAHDAKVVFSSTGGAIYGECTEPASEDRDLEPLSPYGAAKLAAEVYVGMWNRLHGTTHAIARYANVFGPRQDAELEGGVVAIFFERMRRGESTTIYGDGSQTRDFVHVGDIVAATLAAVDAQGVFNVGSGSETTILELHELCARVAGIDSKPQFAAERLGEIRRSVLDATRAGRELGWKPKLTLEEGLRQTWEAGA